MIPELRVVGPADLWDRAAQSWTSAVEANQHALDGWGRAKRSWVDAEASWERARRSHRYARHLILIGVVWTTVNVVAHWRRSRQD